MPALRSAFARVDGTVLKITHEVGDFQPDDRAQGDLVKWDFDEVKVVNDEGDATHVRFDRTESGRVHPMLPSRGDRVSIKAEVRAQRGNVKVTVVSVDAGTYEDHTGTAVPLTLGSPALASV